MAINQGQVSSVLTTALLLEQQVQGLINFAQNAQALIDSGFAFPVPGSTDKVTLTAQQKTDMLAGYDLIKTSLQTVYLTLP